MADFPIDPSMQVESGQPPEIDLEELKKALAALVKDEIESEDDIDRLAYINRTRRNQQFMKGNQFLSPKWNADGTADFASAIAGEGESDGTQARFAYPINITRGDGLKYIAVVGQRAPNVIAVADDVDDNTAVQNTRRSNVAVRTLMRKWKANSLQKVLAGTQWSTGPTYGLTTYVADEHKYGITEEPVIEEQEQIGPDGIPVLVPVQTGTKKYPNGDVELHLFNSLYVSHPFSARSIEDCGYLTIRYQEDKAKLLALYRGKIGDIAREGDEPGGAVSGSQQNADEAMDAAFSPNAVGRPKRKNEWSYGRTWLRPSKFELLKAEPLREQCKAIFPDGVKLVMLGDKVIDLVPERMDDVLAVCKTATDENILADPLCEDSIPIQRACNDIVGLAIETILRGIPKTLIESGLLDRQAIKRNEAIVGELVETMRHPTGRKLEDALAKLPMSEFSPQLPAILNLLRAWGQDINGIRPELTGGGLPTNTFREAKQRKDQAMMQLQPHYDEMQRFWERVANNGCLQLSRFGSGKVKDKSQGSEFGAETEVVDVLELSMEGVHIEAEEGIPMTFAEESSMLKELLTTLAPEVQAALGLLDPLNIPQVHRLLMPMAGFRVPQENELQKIEGQIKELLEMVPIEEIDPMTGQPLGVFRPSIPADEFEDDHMFVVEVIKKWCNSPRGIKMRRENPEGYVNVKAFGQAHMAMIPPPAPMPGDVPPSGPEAGPADAPPGETAPQQSTAAPAPEGPLGPPLPPINEEAPATAA
jgi:hypothetical protein